jgi:Na+-driven multidrug efflux pump
LLVTYISLALNSMLMGLGNTKSLGIISILSVFVNLLVGYYLLFNCNLDITPCCIVLLSSIIAESFAIILMIITICKKNSIDHYFSEILKHKNKVQKIKILLKIKAILF